jgi:hypothetical protein
MAGWPLAVSRVRSAQLTDASGLFSHRPLALFNRPVIGG